MTALGRLRSWEGLLLAVLLVIVAINVDALAVTISASATS